MTKPVIFEWIKDSITEYKLERVGLTFHFDPAIRRSTIDIQGGLHNKARENNSLDEELWMDYALKMEAGNPFVGSVFFLLNNGLYVHGVAHGNHRLRAHAFAHNDDESFLKSAQATVGGYVVDSPYTDDVEEYERLANNCEGGRQSREYAMINALWLVQYRKMLLTAAAQETGISSEIIGRRITANKEREHIEKMGVETHNLTPSHFTRLASLKFDSHKKHLATLANETHLTSPGLSELVTNVKKLRTEAKGNQYIHDEFVRMRRERGGPKNGQEPPEQRRRRLFLKGLRQFENLWLKGNDGRPIHSLTDVGIAPQDCQVRQEVAVRITDLIILMRRAARLGEGTTR